MGTIETAATSYKPTGSKKASTKAIENALKSEKDYDIRNLTLWGVLVYEVTEHWVGILATLGVGYFIFDMFSSLIIGLMGSVFNG